MFVAVILVVTKNWKQLSVFQLVSRKTMSQSDTGVLPGPGKRGTPHGHSNADEPQKSSSKGKMVHSEAACDVTRCRCIEHSGKSKTVETEDPSVSRKIKKGTRRHSLETTIFSAVEGMCYLCVSPGLSKLNFTILNCIIIKLPRGCSN